MNCFLCKGNIERSVTAYKANYNSCCIIIKNVPCTQCTQCGEEYLNGLVLQKIEEILFKLKDTLTGVAVIDYVKVPKIF